MSSSPLFFWGFFSKASLHDLAFNKLTLPPNFRKREHKDQNRHEEKWQQVQAFLKEHAFKSLDVSVLVEPVGKGRQQGQSEGGGPETAPVSSAPTPTPTPAASTNPEKHLPSAASTVFSYGD
jgi:hypothetical protein